MKKLLAVAALFALVAAAVYFSLHPDKTASVFPTTPLDSSPDSNSPPAPPAPIPVSTVNKNPSAPNSSQPVVPASQAGELALATTAAPANLPPETVLRNVGRAVHLYGDMFGGNPVGANSEITSQLAGNNPKHVNFIDPSSGMNVNPSGQLVDAWGSPYFFHQISATEMEIHSAGPDKVMWTSDDLAVK